MVIISVPVLMVSALILLWDRTRIRIQCEPVITLQEYPPTHLGITPITILNGTEVEGYLTLIIKQRIRWPTRTIRSLEFVVPAFLRINPQTVFISIIDTTQPPTEKICGTNKILVYNSNKPLTSSVIEFRFYMRVPLTEGIGRLQEDCEIRLRYKYGRISSRASEKFQLTTFR